MENAKYWKDLNYALAVKMTMEAVQELLDADKAISSKQEGFNDILKSYDIDATTFKSLFIEAGSDSEDENSATLIDLMRMEMNKAAKEAANTLANLVGKDVDDNVDVKTVKDLLTSTTAEKQKEKELEDAKNKVPVEEDTIEKLEAELHHCKEEKTKATKSVNKAKKAKQIRDLQEQLQKSTTTPDSKRKGSPSNSPEPKRPRNEEKEEKIVTTIPVAEVMNKMLEEVTVAVKVLYCAHGVNESPNKWNDKTWKIYETIVGAEDKEYSLIGLGDNAAIAEMEFAECGKDVVVTVTNVKYIYHQSEAKLEMTESSKVEKCNDEKLVKKMENQSLKRCCLKEVLTVPRDKKQRQRFNLQMCCVNTHSDLKYDKNNKPYRLTRIVDGEGSVTNVMVWGVVAEKNVWKRDDIIYIYGTEINYDNQRLDIRLSSYVELAADAANFRQSPKLTYLQYQNGNV